MHELGHTIGIAHCHQASDNTCFDPKCVAFGFGGNLNLSVAVNIMNPACSKNYTRRVFQAYDSSSYQLMYP